MNIDSPDVEYSMVLNHTLVFCYLMIELVMNTQTFTSKDYKCVDYEY